MRILVTGDRGYIGCVLVPYLRDRGHELVGLDADLYRGCTFPGLPEPDWPSLELDVRDVRARDLEGFDAVVHLAALSNDPLSALDERLTYEINHLASVRLARLARETGVERFLFSSSCSNYGAGGGEVLLEEDAGLRPVTAYGDSKVLVERDVGALADDSFSPTFLRNATVYGMSPRLRLDVVVPNLVAWAVTTGAVRLQSDGAQWRPLVHVEDVCRAFGAVLEAPRELVHGEAFNVGGTRENYRVREIAAVVAEVVPDAIVQLAPEASTDARNYRVSCAKLEERLGIVPRWSMRAGVEQHYAAFRTAGLTSAEFEGPRFQRLHRIAELLDGGGLDPSLRFVSVRADEPVEPSRTGP